MMDNVCVDGWMDRWKIDGNREKILNVFAKVEGGFKRHIMRCHGIKYERNASIYGRCWCLIKVPGIKGNTNVLEP